MMTSPRGIVNRIGAREVKCPHRTHARSPNRDSIPPRTEAGWMTDSHWIQPTVQTEPHTTPPCRPRLPGPRLTDPPRPPRQHRPAISRPADTTVLRSIDAVVPPPTTADHAAGRSFAAENTAAPPDDINDLLHPARPPDNRVNHHASLPRGDIFPPQNPAAKEGAHTPSGSRFPRSPRDGPFSHTSDPLAPPRFTRFKLQLFPARKPPRGGRAR